MKLPLNLIIGYSDENTVNPYILDADGLHVEVDAINADLARAKRMEEALREIALMGDKASSWMTQLAGNKARAALAEPDA